MTRPILFSSIIVVTALACSDAPPSTPVTVETESALAAIEERGVLRMLCFPHQNSHFVHPDLDALREAGVPLAELHDSSAYVGVDVELMSAFAEKLGVRLEIHPVTTGYGDLIPALLDGRGDLIASSLTVTEERGKLVDFAPYHTIWVSVVTPVDKPVTSLEELAGKKAALMDGSSQLELLRTIGPEGIELQLTDYTLENYIAIDEGVADFTLVDTSSEPGEIIHRDFPDLRVAFRLRALHYGIALPPGSDLIGPLEAFIAETAADGSFQEMLDRHPEIS